MELESFFNTELKQIEESINKMLEAQNIQMTASGNAATQLNCFPKKRVQTAVLIIVLHLYRAKHWKTVPISVYLVLSQSMKRLQTRSYTLNIKTEDKHLEEIW